jgi:hypothetical protein
VIPAAAVALSPSLKIPAMVAIIKKIGRRIMVDEHALRRALEVARG